MQIQELNLNDKFTMKETGESYEFFGRSRYLSNGYFVRSLVNPDGVKTVNGNIEVEKMEISND